MKHEIIQNIGMVSINKSKMSKTANTDFLTSPFSISSEAKYSALAETSGTNQAIPNAKENVTPIRVVINSAVSIYLAHAKGFVQ